MPSQAATDAWQAREYFLYSVLHAGVQTPAKKNAAMPAMREAAMRLTLVALFFADDIITSVINNKAAMPCVV